MDSQVSLLPLGRGIAVSVGATMVREGRKQVGDCRIISGSRCYDTAPRLRRRFALEELSAELRDPSVRRRHQTFNQTPLVLISHKQSFAGQLRHRTTTSRRPVGNAARRKISPVCCPPAGLFSNSHALVPFLELRRVLKPLISYRLNRGGHIVSWDC